MVQRAWVLSLVVVFACDGSAVHPDAPRAPDAPGLIDAPFLGCPTYTGSGTTHPGTLATAETWRAEDSPHLIPFDMSITAALTIEPCSIVRIAGMRTISVRTGGSVDAQGTPAHPVTIEGSETTHWASFRAVGGTLSFRNTNITGGGNRLSAGALFAGTLEITGTPGAAQPILHVEAVAIRDSETQGVYLHDGGGFDTTSSSLTITGAGGYPIHTFARLAGTLPGGTYTGNATDEILITGTGGTEAVLEDATLHALGVPYHVGTGTSSGYLDVGGVGHQAKLTIEPGVTVRFAPAGRMRIDPASSTIAATGSLVAIGTSAQPIVFTSAAATPAAGDWDGIWFGGIADAATSVQFARVEYAGRATVSGSESCIPAGQVGQNDAAIRIFGGQPAAPFITNTTIVASARYGIDRGFRSDTKPDFVATNTFTSVPACQQTYPRDVSGACPTTIPCP